MAGLSVSWPPVFPLPLYWISPPYTALDPVDHSRPRGGVVRRHSIIALSIAEPERDMLVLADCVRVLRAVVPWHPLALVLRVGKAPADQLIEVGRAAPELRVRCVIADGAQIAAALRQQLTEPECVPGDIVAWMRSVARCSEVAAFLIERLFAGALGRRSVGEILAACGFGSERKVQLRLRDEGLPPPREWRHLAVATYAALRLQRHPKRSLEWHALALGHGERSTLIRQLRAVFAAPPRAVRQTVGWEPWVWRWLGRWRSKGYFADVEVID